MAKTVEGGRYSSSRGKASVPDGTDSISGLTSYTWNEDSNCRKLRFARSPPVPRASKAGRIPSAGSRRPPLNGGWRGDAAQAVLRSPQTKTCRAQEERPPAERGGPTKPGGGQRPSPVQRSGLNPSPDSLVTPIVPLLLSWGCSHAFLTRPARRSSAGHRHHWAAADGRCW